MAWLVYFFDWCKALDALFADEEPGVSESKILYQTRAEVKEQITRQHSQSILKLSED